MKNLVYHKLDPKTKKCVVTLNTYISIITLHYHLMVILTEKEGQLKTFIGFSHLGSSSKFSSYSTPSHDDNDGKCKLLAKHCPRST